MKSQRSPQIGQRSDSGIAAIPNRSISSNSVYSSLTWDFTHETGDPSAKIHWDTRLSNGRRLCDYYDLCEPLRIYFEAISLGRALSGRRMKLKTATKRFYGLRAFADFLITKRNIHSFDAVLPSDHEAYLKMLRAETRPHSSLMKLTSLLHFFAAHSRHDIRLPLGSNPPFAGLSPYKLLGIKFGEKERFQTEVIPDSILWPLFNYCVDYIQNAGPYLISVKKRLDEFEKQFVKHSTNRYSHRPGAPTALQNLFRYGLSRTSNKFQLAGFERLTVDFPRPTSRLLEREIGDLTELRVALDDLLAACFILLGLVTGMRREELGSVEEDCLSKTVTVSGESIFWISALFTKGTSDDRGRICKWVCGEYGKLAIEMLTQLTVAQRTVKKTRRLFCALRSTWRTQNGHAHHLARIKWGKHLDRFMKRCSLSYTPAGTNTPKLWRLKPHQLRRTFLRMLVRYGDVSLRALQIHCKHLNSHMTDYYLGSDTELWLEFQNEADEFRLRVYAQALGEEAVSGGGGRRMVKEINEAIDTGRIPANFRGQAGDQFRMKWAERALRGGKQLHLLSTNFCDFKSSEAFCNKGGTEPIAQNCSTACKCNKITSVHGPAWLLIARQSKEALIANKNSNILRPALKTQLAQANKVLKDLGITPV